MFDLMKFREKNKERKQVKRLILKTKIERVIFIKKK